MFLSHSPSPTGSLDYLEGIYLAEFLPGQSTTCIVVVIMNDTIIETTEEFNLVIREIGPTDVGVIIGDPDVAIVTIYDNTGNYVHTLNHKFSVIFIIIVRNDIVKISFV